MGVSLNAVVTSVAACGVLLIAGCSSGTTASAPSVATSAAVSEMSSAAPAPMSSAPAEVPAAVVLAKWSCTKDGEEVTCVCEGSEADCKSTVAEPSKVKGSIGTVLFFMDKRGFGFISPDEGGEDIFVHFSSINMNGSRTLREGQRVCFEITNGVKGKQASNVQQC